VGGWVGRMMRGVRKHKLEGERGEVEKERTGLVGWKIMVKGNKRGMREEWEDGREERERDWVLGVNDASGEGRGIGIGVGVWEGSERRIEWSMNGGMSLTVDMGEMYRVKKVLEKVEGEYRGNKEKLIDGMDNIEVLRKLGKGRGICGKIEQDVRKIGIRLMEKRWVIKLMWVGGHVGIEKNEVEDKRAKEGYWEEEEGDVGNVLG